MKYDKDEPVANGMIRVLMILFLALLPLTAFAQPQAKPEPPRVLIIGDRVYQQFVFNGTRDEIKGQAKVQLAAWPKEVLPSSTNMIEHLDQLLGLKDGSGNDVPQDKRPRWDLIHFNVGLGDLIYRVPNLKSHRTLPYDQGGVHRTDAKQYEKNLDTLVGLLKQKAPGAKIIWASTTPIRSSRDRYFKVGDEVEYNQIAQRVMSKHRIPINDMHAYARSIINMEKPAPRAMDPFFFDNKPLHHQAVDTIVRELGLKPIDRKPKEDKKK